MIDLKWLNPCPTCGKKDEINSGQTSPGKFFVRCNRCMVSVNDDRKEKVQAEWNEIGQGLRERVKELEEIIVGINSCQMVGITWPNELKQKVEKIWEAAE